MLASVVLPAPERYRDPQQRALFYQRMLDTVRTIPNIAATGTADALPFSGENHGGYVSGGVSNTPPPSDPLATSARTVSASSGLNIGGAG